MIRIEHDISRNEPIIWKCKIDGSIFSYDGRYFGSIPPYKEGSYSDSDLELHCPLAGHIEKERYYVNFSHTFSYRHKHSLLNIEGKEILSCPLNEKSCKEVKDGRGSIFEYTHSIIKPANVEVKECPIHNSSCIKTSSNKLGDSKKGILADVADILFNSSLQSLITIMTRHENRLWSRKGLKEYRGDDQDVRVVLDLSKEAITQYMDILMKSKFVVRLSDFINDVCLSYDIKKESRHKKIFYKCTNKKYELENIENPIAKKIYDHLKISDNGISEDELFKVIFPYDDTQRNQTYYIFDSNAFNKAKGDLLAFIKIINICSKDTKTKERIIKDAKLQLLLSDNYVSIIYATDETVYKFPEKKDVIIMGRFQNADIVIPDVHISRKIESCVKIIKKDKNYYITNNTETHIKINDNLIERQTILRNGDEIKIGTSIYYFTSRYDISSN